MLRRFSQKILFWCNGKLRGFEIVFFFREEGGKGNFAEGIFLLGGENLRSDFDHFRPVCLFHLTSKGNPAIFVQFIPKYQNPMSHDSLCRSFLT